jgi:serine/threonine protein kinase
LARALREVSILGEITIPEVVKLGSIKARVENVGGLECLGYTEEWIDGENLWDILRSLSRIPPSEEECRCLLKCLVTSVQSLWALDKVHRDIKPLNVMRLPQQDRPFVLLDLGIAYDLSEPGLTYNTALVPCTYRYLAPEMTELKFRDRLDFRSDLYTTGLTVYEFASGRHPIAHNTDDLVRTITRALHDLPPPLHSLRSDFSEPFCSLIDQLLRKKPMLRPGNLEQLQKRIQSLP